MALSVEVASSLCVGEPAVSLSTSDIKTMTHADPGAIVGWVPSARILGLPIQTPPWVIYLFSIRRRIVCESQLSARPACPPPVPHGEKGWAHGPNQSHIISNVDKGTELGE